jgi:hypothetical protein
LRRHEDVVGLEIAVDDPLVMGGSKRIGNLQRVLDALGSGEPFGLEALA